MLFLKTNKVKTLIFSLVKNIGKKFVRPEYLKYKISRFFELQAVEFPILLY